MDRVKLTCYHIVMNKRLYLLLFILFILGGGYFYWQYTKPEHMVLPLAKNINYFTNDNVSSSTEGKIIEPEIEEVTSSSQAVVSPIKLAQEINLAIPFTSQAPTQNWDQPFQDACEEASLLMVDYYYQNKKLPDKSAVENILRQMVLWQEQNWGGHHNLSISKLAEFALINFNYHGEIVNDLTADKIRTYLRAGKPLIVPADGKKLANPNFRNGGPAYHMLVIKGFVGDKFITNDPGTRKGEDFVYTEKNLMESIADWDESKSAASGPKTALIILPK